MIFEQITGTVGTYLPNYHQINKKIDIVPTTVQLKQRDESEKKIFLWISTQTYARLCKFKQ